MSKAIKNFDYKGWKVRVYRHIHQDSGTVFFVYEIDEPLENDGHGNVTQWHHWGPHLCQMTEGRARGIAKMSITKRQQARNEKAFGYD